MWNRSEQRGMGRRDLFAGGAVTTALAAIAAPSLPLAFLRQPWRLDLDAAGAVHHAQLVHPDDYSDFWASG